ncbi:MAG TPA: ATP-binding protein [Bryobacteraceae bacterium]|nr:ATP-binding protein [Bryobacteraceae bacterium]
MSVALGLTIRWAYTTHKHGRDAEARRKDLEKLRELGRTIPRGEGVQAALQQFARRLMEIFDIEGAAIYDRTSGQIIRAGAGAVFIADEQLRVAAGQATPITAAHGVCIAALRSNGHTTGSLAINGAISPGLLELLVQEFEVWLATVRAAENARQAKRARAAEDLKSAVLDALAHEIRGPMGTIKIAVTTLLSNPPRSEAQGRELLILIAEEVNRIDRWVDEAARASRTEARELQPRMHPQHLRSLVRTVLKDMAPQVAGRPIPVRIDEALPMVDCDKGMIGGVLSQLLDNALKYSPARSPISIACESQDNAAIISVADRGPGVADDERERIFDEYFRGRAAKPGVRGTGLGLPSAKRVVEAHGGSMWVTSRPEGGAVFHFSIPFAKEAPGDCTQSLDCRR